MAYINGNKPIVTNGLVYALDFGNTKSYVSGSNRGFSLAYDPATTIVTGSTAIPTLSATGLTFSGSQFIQRSASLSALDPNGTFTICAVVKANTSGTLFTQNSSVGNLSGRFQSTSSLSTGFTLSSGDFSRIYTGNFTGSQHVTYRYNSGSFDTFINGIPVTASQANTALTGSGLTSTLFINSGSLPFSGSLSSFYVYNRALTADEVYQNFEIASTRYSLPYRPKPYTIDENLYQFLQTTGITDTVTTNALSTFISGLKSNGLWNKMVAIYPFVSNTTASLTTNLKEPGLYRLGLTGSFSASSAGLTPSSSTAFIDTIPGNTAYASVNSQSAHLTLLSYDLPTGNGFLAGNSAPAVGGDLIISSGSRMYHVYRNVGTSSFYMTNPAITNVEVLVVAGGGAGGNGTQYNGGGGGAGGLIQSSSFTITPGSNIEVIVGSGGTVSTLPASTNGENSKFSSIVAIGGGSGGSGRSMPGIAGGSGGGGAGTPGTTDIPSGLTAGGLGTPGQGNDGAVGQGGNAGRPFGGGGGGGAGTPGFSGSITPLRGSDGGSGSYFAQYAGLNLGFPSGWFAGGGAGSSDQGGSFGGTGGLGGGASAPPFSGPFLDVYNGRSNTGGGGGACGYNSAPLAGVGGSGIVIVSYDLPASALTGSGTGLYLTETSITGSVNSQFTSGITGSGNIGLLTVTRTQPAIFSIHKNNISQSVASASLGALSSDIFFNTANLAGSSSLPLQSAVSFASIGSGLTTTEVATYHNLIGQLQANLKRQNTLLDNYSGAAAAYSLRRIGPSNYFGPAIRVRRDSDNTLRDIGFTSDGQLDTVGLLDFVGVTGSGFVNTWYDQSGNNNNATQATSANQPRVVTNGIISYINVYPSVEFTFESSSFMQLTNTFSGNAGSRFFISKLKAIPIIQSQTAYPFDDIGSSNASSYYPNLNSTLADDFASTTRKDPAGTSPGLGLLQPHLHSTISLPNFWTNYHNNNQLFSTTTNTVGFNTTPSLIGSGTGFVTSYLDGYISEILFYTSNQTSNRTAIESNINTNYKIYGSATASFDPDYSAFITATGITQPTQSTALKTLVSDLKSYGLWNKMKAIYPMITDKNNRFAYSQELNTEWNPVNTVVATNNVTAPDGTLTAERLTETTSSITTYTVSGDGSNFYFTSSISGPILGGNPTLTLEKGKTYNFVLNNASHPFFIMTGSGAYTVGGQYNDGVTGQGTSVGTLTFVVPAAAPSTLGYACSVHSPMNGSLNIINNTDTHYIYQTIADGLTTGSEYVASIHARFLNRPWIAMETNTGAKAWFNIQTGITGSLTGSNATITSVGSGWYRCALYFTSSVASGPQNIQYNLADANGNLSYAGVAGTGSYLWGAQFENGNVLGPYRATTATGFTTGSMLDQMKYNLKNAVDTDAAFRLTYSGSWNAGYSGNKGDGVTAYADTKFNPNSEASIGANDMHISAYTNTNKIGSEANIIGAYDNNRETAIAPRWSDSRFYFDINDNVFTSISTPNALSQGYYIGNKNNTGNNLGYKNGIKVINGANISDGKTNLTLYLGARRVISGIDRYSTYTMQIITIGDGLTDYEAKALYWIVQKYQTTLGRQVY